MEEMNNRGLEDFFKSSLEKFDQEPDDKVWVEVSNLLDSDEENEKKPFWFGIISKLSLFIISIIIVGFLFSRLNNNNKVLSEISPAVSSQYSENKKAVTESQNLNSSPFKANENNTKKSNYHQKIEDIQSEKTNLESDSSNKAIQLKKEKVYSESSSETPTVAEPVQTNIREIHSTNENNSRPQEQQTIISALPFLKNKIQQVTTNSVSIFKEPHKVHFIKPQEGPVVSSRYRIGISSRFFHTAASETTDFNGCESHGLVQDYKLNENLELNLGMYINVQHYDITTKNSGETINELVVRQYTSRNFAESGITEIDATTHYFDLPIGLRWHFRKVGNKSSLYVNPAIVWQIYFPQKFGFTTVDNLMAYRDYNGITASLGSSSLSFGLERKLTNWLTWRFGIWGEYSFIPLGIQNEKFKMLGIKTSFLFGKKSS